MGAIVEMTRPEKLARLAVHRTLGIDNNHHHPIHGPSSQVLYYVVSILASLGAALSLWAIYGK